MSKPISSLSSVDLPQPLGPTIATNSPARTSKDTSSRTRGPSSEYRKDSRRASIAPVSGPGRVLAVRTSGVASSTGLISSKSGSAATADTNEPVSWVTEVSSIVTEVLKVRNAAADIVPRAGPASSMNISSVHTGRYTAPITVVRFLTRPTRCWSSRLRANCAAQAAYA